MEDTHEVSQREPIICNNALYLMELCKVGGIQGLVSENTVNGEILDRTELLLRNERQWKEEHFSFSVMTVTV